MTGTLHFHGSLSPAADLCSGTLRFSPQELAKIVLAGEKLALQGVGRSGPLGHSARHPDPLGNTAQTDLARLAYFLRTAVFVDARAAPAPRQLCDMAGEKVAPGSGLAVAATAARAGTFVAVDPRAVLSVTQSARLAPVRSHSMRGSSQHRYTVVRSGYVSH
jgi:hypothetical protein